jgi:hypothetical protein
MKSSAKNGSESQSLQARAIEMSRHQTAARTPQAQIVAVTTAEIGPRGPLTKIYAVGFETQSQAMEAINPKLKPGETAKWLEARSLSVVEGEIRLI